MAKCSHSWLIVSEHGVNVVLNCELCRAVVVCVVGHHGTGHSFGFAILHGSVAGADLQALGEWFGRQVGEELAVHFDMRPARRREVA